MLSYQHAYHAGNLADVHKHAALASMLDYLTRKDKPLSYIETHAGRALYDLESREAQKTGEAAEGILRLRDSFAGHPYGRALATVAEARGARQVYPGSPLIAATLLRAQDRLHLAELHPGEFAALDAVGWGPNVTLYHRDGLALAQSLCPPEPRRGLLLVDPSYEVKTEYAALPKALAGLHRKWNVGVLVLWYPLLDAQAHLPMLAALTRLFPEALRHEVVFTKARDTHRMHGSGLFVVNPPWGFETEARALSDRFAAL